MLNIRKEQSDAMDKAAIKSFKDRMVDHLNKFFPEHCEELGSEGTREAICYAVGRAAEYGISAERDICIYTDIMVVFGQDFDEDPEFPWAQEILNDDSLEDEPAEKVDRLHEAATKHIEKETESPTGMTDQT